MIEDALNKYPSIGQVLMWGGKSSAKSFTASQFIEKDCIENVRNAILFRKERSRVETTIKRTMSLAIDSTRLQNAWHKMDRKFKSKLCKSEIFMAGLDEEDKAKGVEGFNYVLYDELNQFTFKEYNQTILSLRGEGRKVFFGTWNPVSKNSWLKVDLIDQYQWLPTEYELPNPKSSVRISDCGSILLIHTNYLDNYWSVGSPCGTYGYRDEKLLAKYEKLRTTPRLIEDYKVNVLGLWGNTNKGGEFYKAFNHFSNVDKQENRRYNKDLPLHISFDENTMPYVSLSIYQGEGKNPYKIDEICLKHPLNTLKHTLTEFTKRYKNHNLRVYVYGDRTSKKADSKLEKGHNFYTMISDRLRLEGFKHTERIPKQNPSVHLRKEFMNDLLAGDIEGASYVISDKCQNTIDDYDNLKEAPDGGKHKSMIKDPVTKIRYQEYGHLTDTDDYFLCEYLKEEYQKYSKTNKSYRRSTGFKI